MRGCLFTVALGAVTAALLVALGLPALAAGLLTAGVGAAGLRADDTAVTVTADPPWDLLSLHADRARVVASDATFRGIAIGSLDVTLLDVDILGRTAGGVAGRLTGVTVDGAARAPLRLAAVTLGGGTGRVTVATGIAAADARSLVAGALGAATGAAVPPAAVRLAAPDRVTVGGRSAWSVRLAVDAAGDLVALGAGAAPVVLVRGGQDVPVRFTAVSVDGGGSVVLSGVLSVGLLGG